MDRLEIARFDKKHQMQEELAAAKAESSRLVNDLAQAEADANVHHRQTTENTENLRLEVANLRRTITYQEARSLKQAQNELAFTKANTQLRTRFALGRCMAAILQHALMENSQVLITQRTHFKALQSHHCSDSVGRLTRTFKALKPKKTDRAQEKILPEQVTARISSR
jgi:hypothetical protein